MRRWIPIALVACAGGADDDADTATCALTAEVIHPTTGEVFPGGPFEVQLSASDPDATFTEGLTYARGGNVVGAWFDPPLASGAEVTLTLETCAGPQTFEVRTADVGGALDGGVDLTMQSFDVELTDLTFLRPETFGDLVALAGSLSTRLLIGAVAQEGDTLTLRLAVADDAGAQDLCSRTLDVAGVQRTGGFLILPAVDLTFPIGDATLDLKDMRATLALASDGSAITGGAISAWVGVEGMAALWADGDVDQACEFFAGLQMPCVDCPDGGTCLVLDGVGITGEAAAITPAQVTAACPE